MQESLLKRSLPSVLPLMRLQRPLVPQHLAAITTLELWLFVGRHVLPQARDGFRTLSTVGTLEAII